MNFSGPVINNRYIKTIAGTGTAGTAGAGTATAQPINNPTAVLVDNVGNVFIGCRTSGQILKVTPAGAMTVLFTGVNSFFNMCWDKTSNYNTIIIIVRASPPATMVYKYVISTNTYSALITLSYYGGFVDCDSTGKLYISSDGGCYTSTVSGAALTPFTSTGITPALPASSVAIYVDSSDNAYFTGSNGTLLKYSSSGVWSVVFSNVNYSIGFIAIAPSGTIYAQYNNVVGANYYYNIGIITDSSNITYISGIN
jgi:hypothetical protein